MNQFNRFGPLVARILLAQIFLISGLTKIMDWSGTMAYMESQGMILVPLLLFMAIVVELLAGLSILLGIKARIGALTLLLYLVPTTLIFHNFWDLEGQLRQVQMIMFMKNLAIMGGLMMVVSAGAGELRLGD